MYFNFYLILCLLGITLAVPINLAADPAVETSIKRIGTALDKLDAQWKTTKPWNDATESEKQAANALQLTRGVVESLRTGTSEIRRGPDISTTESVRLRQWSDSLTKLYQSSMKGWVNAKKVVQSAGKKPVVLDVLLQLLDATTIFNDAIGDKMSNLAEMFGQSYKNQQVRAVQSAIDTYKR